MIKPLDIRDSDLSIVQTILKNSLPPETKVWVFGSRASGTTKRSSDLDLAIDAKRALTHSEKTKLLLAFEDSDLPYKVDVVDLQVINQNFKQLIERACISLPGFEGS